jgi:hypothetical protein
MSEEIHVSDVGVQFEYRLLNPDASPLDVSTASLIQLVYSRPSDTNLIVNASLLTDGIDGWIKYVTRTGDLSKSGKWTVQVYLEIGDAKFHSGMQTFLVYPNILD